MFSIASATNLPRPARRPSVWLGVAVGLWAIGVLAGLGSLWSYALRPGAETAAPKAWPQASGLARVPGRWTLVMFLHPRCPCSRASLAELDKLLARSSGVLQGWIVAVRPSGTHPDWPHTAAMRRASALTGTQTIVDDGGRLAGQFQARTSGETFLYHPAGQLVFHGGLTPARGHEGDNPGSEAILAYLRGRWGSSITTTPVFGCPLLESHTPSLAAARKPP